MQNNRFLVLTGHLSNYPLADLIGILRHQRKTGRLTIEYPKGPATFFFHEGELVDAQLNDLIGLQAICVAVGQPEASFNFNPLIRPSRRSIEPSLQRVVSELLGCWDESALQVEATASIEKPQKLLPPTNSDSCPPYQLPAGTREPLQLPPGAPTTIPRRSLVFIAAAGLLIAVLSTVIAVIGRRNFAPQISERTTGTHTEGTDATPPRLAQTEIRTDVTNDRSKVTRTMDHSRRQETLVSPVRQDPDKKAGPLSETLSKGSSLASSQQVTTASGPATNAQSVNVVMQIENGRVLKASIADHKAGMDPYEGLALRIARQRRYPSKISGQQSVTISIARPN